MITEADLDFRKSLHRARTGMADIYHREITSRLIDQLDDLRQYVHTTLCEKENLLPEQFSITEMLLSRHGRNCGLQFSLHGPRNVRLGTIWAAESNMPFFYDARSQRYLRIRLPQRPALRAV